MEALAYVIGVAVLLVLWLAYRVLAGKWNIWTVVEGADGLASASKLQWFLWTAVVIFSYSTIWAIRALGGNFSAIDSIPKNVLIAMGFSATTMAAAKGITVGYLGSGKILKPPVTASAKASAGGPPVAAVASVLPTPSVTGPGAIFQDDDGVPDLSKIQMLAWTAIASVIYVIAVVDAVHRGALAVPPNAVLPNIDASLMVLMGLGQGAYIGKKLTTDDTPRLIGLAPSSAKPPIEVTVGGGSFGKQQAGSIITLDGSASGIVVSDQNWSDTQIKFALAATQPDGTSWRAGQTVQIGVIVGGQASANSLPFTISGP